MCLGREGGKKGEWESRHEQENEKRLSYTQNSTVGKQATNTSYLKD